MNVSQIVISKLKAESERELFFEITKRMVIWLSNKPGFKSYQLYENGLHMSDVIVYDSIEAANVINAEFHKTRIYEEFMTLVEPTYTGFIGVAVNLASK